MSWYPLMVSALAWIVSILPALAADRAARPVALFVLMHVIAVGSITVLVATQTIHWGALALPLATLRSVFRIANDWPSKEGPANERVRSTALKVPAVCALWIGGWALLGSP